MEKHTPVWNTYALKMQSLWCYIPKWSLYSTTSDASLDWHKLDLTSNFP